MKKAIVYYSMFGNTDYVANYISKKISADLIRVEPKRKYPNKGLRKFIWGGKSAIMGETPELEDYSFDEAQYDYIIFGSPIWASRVTPPIRTFIKENKEKLEGKKFAVFTCFSGSGSENAIEKLKQYLGINQFQAKLELVDPKDKRKEEKKKKIDEFCEKINN